MVAFGILVTWGDKLPVKLGRLPGDIRYEGKNGSFYFPLTTCILLSVLFTILSRIFGGKQ
jgi:hypothetical protein